jgi:hypothetical protein
MGQRADNFLHAFNGASLNWEHLFGAGFSDVPKHWVSVYRECSLDELMRIAREGMTVPPPEMRLPEMRAEMEVLDRFRPAKNAKQGVSRLDAIYAAPTPETPRFPFRNEHIVLEMKVDPAECFVGDMDFITCLIPFIGVRRYGLEKFRGAFRKYWESVIPLKDFLSNYSRLETGDGSHWILKKQSSADGLPKSFFVPEVLVMTPRISQRHIRILRRDRSVEQATELAKDHVIELWNEEVE